MGSPSPTLTSTLVCPLRAVGETVNYFCFEKIEEEKEKEMCEIDFFFHRYELRHQLAKNTIQLLAY